MGTKYTQFLDLDCGNISLDTSILHAKAIVSGNGRIKKFQWSGALRNKIISIASCSDWRTKQTYLTKIFDPFSRMYLRPWMLETSTYSLIVRLKHSMPFEIFFLTCFCAIGIRFLTWRCISSDGCDWTATAKLIQEKLSRRCFHCDSICKWSKCQEEKYRVVIILECVHGQWTTKNRSHKSTAQYTRCNDKANMTPKTNHFFLDSTIETIAQHRKKTNTCRAKMCGEKRLWNVNWLS